MAIPVIVLCTEIFNYHYWNDNLTPPVSLDFGGDASFGDPSIYGIFHTDDVPVGPATGTGSST